MHWRRGQIRWWAIAERLVFVGKSVKFKFQGVFCTATLKVLAYSQLSADPRIESFKSIKKLFHQMVVSCPRIPVRCCTSRDKSSGEILERSHANYQTPSECRKLHLWGAIVSLNVLFATLVKNVEINRNHRMPFQVI